MGSDFQLIQNAGLVRSAETSALNPGIREIASPLGTKKQNAADCRHQSSLMPDDQMKSLKRVLIPVAQSGNGSIHILVA
jgi:hypothetical protein